MTHPLHPMLVHFPIALLLTSLVFDLIAVRWQSDRFRTTSFHTLIAGLIGTILALISGGIAEEAVEHSGIPKEPLERHEEFAFASFAIFALVLVLRIAMRWGMIKEREWLTIAMAGVGALILSITGYYGGSLVYDLGAGVSRP